ncbi:MAG: DUF3881 family protein [Defluviitaleaceae bacterium]|nr:DUF3881 family protein [Defluviitaleaceae bacterium]
MKANDFFNALGMKDIINNKSKLNKMLRLSTFAPDFVFEDKRNSQGQIFFTRYKFIGKGFGVWVGGRRHTQTDEEGKETEKYVVMDWGLFANGAKDVDISGLYVDTSDSGNFFCFACNVDSGNYFEFFINNPLELISNYRKMDNYDKVLDFENNISKANFAMLMAFATILLPIKKELRASRETGDKQRETDLRLRAISGDLEAELELCSIYDEQQADLRERLLKEDMFSVLESFFLNLDEQTGIFSVLAEILDFKEIINEVSKEKIIRLDTNITGINISMYVNEKEINGIPSVGMRIMGIGILQGFIRTSSAK